MTSLVTIRHAQTNRARRIFAGFVVIWLNLVFQPCAMAMDGGDAHDCPDCPPQHTSMHMDHGETDVPVGMTEMPCASGTDCSVIDNVYFDARSTKLEATDLPDELPLVIYPPYLNQALPRSSVCPSWHRLRSPPPGNSVALNILHCVYLK